MCDSSWKQAPVPDRTGWMRCCWLSLHGHGLADTACAMLHLMMMCSVQITNDTLAGFGEPKIYGFDSGQQGLFQTAAECCAKCRKNPEVLHPLGPNPDMHIP